MQDYHISNSNLSLIDKLSYVKNSDTYNSIFFKFRTMCKLIFTCGKYDLKISPSHCEYFVNHRSKTIFARRVEVVMATERNIADKRLAVGDSYLCFNKNDEVFQKLHLFSLKDGASGNSLEDHRIKSSRQIAEKMSVQDVDVDKRGYVNAVALALQRDYPVPDGFDKKEYRYCMRMYAMEATRDCFLYYNKVVKQES